MRVRVRKSVSVRVRQVVRVRWEAGVPDKRRWLGWMQKIQMQMVPLGTRCFSTLFVFKRLEHEQSQRDGMADV